MSTRNSNSPIRNIEKKTRRITGKHRVETPLCLRIIENIKTDHRKLADALACNTSHISSKDYYDQSLSNIKVIRETMKLNFKVSKLYDTTNICQIFFLRGVFA